MTEQSDVLDGIYREAHDRHSESRKIAAYVSTEVDRLEGSGAAWVEAAIADAKVTGWMKKCSDWRRSEEKRAVPAASGKAVEAPAWASVREVDDEGATVYVQMRFELLDRDQVQAYIDNLGKSRDTLSERISAARAVLAYMDAHPECERAGDALNALGLAA